MGTLYLFFLLSLQLVYKISLMGLKPRFQTERTYIDSRGNQRECAGPGIL